MTGYFFENGTSGGEPAYERADGGAWLWSFDNRYNMSVAKGVQGTAYWSNATEFVVPGSYDPLGTATGIATVAAVIE